MAEWGGTTVASVLVAVYARRAARGQKALLTRYGGSENGAYKPVQPALAMGVMWR
jgi:ribosomal protein S19E (S16A)